MKELWKVPDSIRNSNIRIIEAPEEEEREKGTDSLFKQIVDKNFPELWEELHPQIQAENRIPCYLNPKRPSPRPIVKKTVNN